MTGLYRVFDPLLTIFKYLAIEIIEHGIIKQTGTYNINNNHRYPTSYYINYKRIKQKLQHYLFIFAVLTKLNIAASYNSLKSLLLFSGLYDIAIIKQYKKTFRITNEHVSNIIKNCLWRIGVNNLDRHHTIVLSRSKLKIPVYIIYNINIYNINKPVDTPSTNKKLNVTVYRMINRYNSRISRIHNYHTTDTLEEQLKIIYMYIRKLNNYSPINLIIYNNKNK